MTSQPVRAVIFDLDGVIVSTDHCHYLAWKQIAEEVGIDFSEAQGHRCRGVSRMESLEIVLEGARRVFTAEQKESLAAKKNALYLRKILALGPGDLLPGVMDFLRDLRSEGVLQAIGSSSKNTPVILHQIGLHSWFDAVADGNDILHSKPHPEVFLTAASRLSMSPEFCVVIEDAAAGVEAGLAAGMRVFAVGEACKHPGATAAAGNLEAMTFRKFCKLLGG